MKQEPKPNQADVLEVPVRNTTQLGTAILRFRKHNGWTQNALGKRAGLKQPIVSTTEHGASGTSLETFFKLLAALDLEIVVRRRRKSEPWSGGSR